MRNRVVITGMGIVSSLGDSPFELHASLCEGRSGIKPIELFDTQGLGCSRGGEIRCFDAKKYLGGRNLRPLDRTSRLVASAAQLALDESRLTDVTNTVEVGLVLGTMFCSVRTISEFDRRSLEAGPAYASPMDFSNTVINAAAGQTAIMHGLRGINSTISTNTTSGLQAIAYASDIIRTGGAQVILAGGADELCFESFYGFDRAGLLCRSDNAAGGFPIPFDTRRNGTVLGEGAALLVLENAASAYERGANVIAEITGHGASYDCSRGTNDTEAAEAVALSIQQALNDAFTLPHEIDCLSASANGSLAGDRHEAQGALIGLNGQARRLPVTAIKSMLGETLGASGSFQVVAMVEAMRDGVLPGICNLQEVENNFPFQSATAESRQIDLQTGLINSLGLDGHCCSLVVTRCNQN